MDKRFYYDIGMHNDNMAGNLMASSHKNAMDIIIGFLDDLGITQNDIEYLNIEAVDNDDIMGMQYDTFRTTKSLLGDILIELSISPTDLRNHNTQLSNDTESKIIKMLGI